MAPRAQPEVGQGGLWTPNELPTPTFEDLGIPATQVISMSRLLKAVSSAMELPTSYVSVTEFEQSTPQAIHPHLYIDRNDPRSRTAENLFMGVVHPTEEFSKISRSPSEIARQVKNKTRKSFNVEEAITHGRSMIKVTDSEGKEVDRDTINDRVQRSAGHALGGFLEKVVERRRLINERLSALSALDRQLKSPGKAHYKAENLNRLRITGEQAIREAIEVASINADWTSLTVDGLHKAAMYKIYGMPGHNNARLGFFRPWTLLTLNWTRARSHNIETAQKNCEKHLAIYQPALDAVRPT